MNGVWDSVLGALGTNWAYNTGVLGLYVTGGNGGASVLTVWLSAAVRTMLLVVAIWRVSYMFVMEDGPWLIFDRLRRLRGTEVTPNHELVRTRPGTAWSCINCMSIWVAMWLPFLWPPLVAIIALSGGAIWFRRHSLG